MSMQAARRGRRMALLGLLAALGCASMAPDEGEGPREGERKKSWSGFSWAAETRVDATPSASFASGGFDQERVWGGGDDWEPAVAADPGAPYVYQLTTRYGGPRADLVFRRSADGGATWDADQVFGNDGYDPMIEVADDGTIFAMGLFGNAFKLRMRRSYDHGDSWTSLDNILPPGGGNWGDRPVLAISPDGQDVYVAFNRSDSFVVSSHDGGDSFGPAVQTNSDARYWFHSGGAVAPNGDIYFAAADYAQDYSGDVRISVLRSTDAGASWTTTPLATSAETPDCAWAAGCYFGFLGPSVGLAIDVDGRVLVAYHAGGSPGAPQQLWVRSSSDGVGWSAPLQVSTSTTGVHNAFPAIGASRVTPGDFRVVWQDDREASEVGWNTWIRRSLDGGASWGEPERLSDLASGAPYKSAAGFAFPYGDYLEIAVDGQDLNHVIWGEGSSYTGPGGTWYTRGTALPEPASAVQLAVGLVLLSGLGRLRRLAHSTTTRTLPRFQARAKGVAASPRRWEAARSTGK